MYFDMGVITFEKSAATVTVEFFVDAGVSANSGMAAVFCCPSAGKKIAGGCAANPSDNAFNVNTRIKVR